MLKKLILPIIVITLGCRENTKTSPFMKGDTKFEQISEDFIKGYLAWRPEMSVALGIHEFDGVISNFSKDSRENELSRLKKYDQLLHNFDTTSLRPKAYYDFRILQCGIKRELFNFEVTGIYTKNPMTYAGAMDLSVYIKRNFAPLRDRLKAVIAIEKAAPVFFATAKSNLADSLAQPYIETAIQIARGFTDFFNSDLKMAFRELGKDSLMTVFDNVNHKAILELNAFITWLEKEKLPKAHNHYALGKEKYRKMLLFSEDISMDPEKILAIGQEKLEQEKAIFKATAKVINPRKKAVEVYQDLQKEHPSSNNLIRDVKKNVESIRQFILDKKIVTMPSEAQVKVKETPIYARSTSTASMDPPGPFERKATEAYYYITPVDLAWTAKQKEDWLSMFDYYTTDNVSIHEVYPGHYTQFQHLSSSQATRIEKIFESYAFMEGWAHYTEELMVEEGYGKTNDPVKSAKYHLAQSGDALLRLCRLCVSVKMHCQGMSVDDATKFFMENWYQGEKPSRQEAIRGTYDPEYLYYTLGKLQMLKLREDYKKQEGAAFTLQKFHDLVLDNGMPPIQLLRELLLKDNGIWKEIL
jgi:uncharacterized protein (DUF885 family)